MAIEMEVHSDLAIPPGEYLEEVLDDLGMTKDELAKRMGRPAPKLSAIYRGGKAITSETALQLEKVVGIPAHIWTGLESEYRLTLARQAERREDEHLKEEAGLVAAFCYKQLARLGKVKDTRIGKERVRELHRFLGVTSLRSVENVSRYGLAFRQISTSKNQPGKEALVAWLRVGERAAHVTDCKVFHKALLQKALGEIRSMTTQGPDKFLTRLRELLAECGIVLVLCPHFPKTYVHGATFSLGQEKVVVMMTIRGKWSDIFWFSLFHELGHVLLHGQRKMFLEHDGGNPEHIKQEEEANIFAGDSLIPPESYQKFTSLGDYSEISIRRFAKEVQIHPGIVVGRLHNDRHLQHRWLNKLRIQYEWKDQ